jgi:flavodoxin
MKKVLVVFESRTGRTKRMAEKIAEGIRASGHEARVGKTSEFKSASELEGYDGYLFGSPTYFRDTTDAMKTFLFLARKAPLEGKLGGAFGSYTHIGSGPGTVYDTMENVFRMKMAGVRPFNMKEQILDAGKGDQPCVDYGKAVAEKL